MTKKLICFTTVFGVAPGLRRQDVLVHRSLYVSTHHAARARRARASATASLESLHRSLCM